MRYETFLSLLLLTTTTHWIFLQEDISYPNKYKLEKLLTNVLDKSSQQADLCLNGSNENTLRCSIACYNIVSTTKFSIFESYRKSYLIIIELKFILKENITNKILLVIEWMI